MRSCIVANSRRGSQRVDGAITSFRESWSPEGQEATPKILSDKRAFLLTSPICQATFFRLALGCPRRTLSICLCNAASIFLFASSKLLPRTVSDRSSQTPFQPSPSSPAVSVLGHRGLAARRSTAIRDGTRRGRRFYFWLADWVGGLITKGM